MATLSELCALPNGWGVPSVSEQIGMSKKLAWKLAKRKEHERMKAFREREAKRASKREPKRKRVPKAETMQSETCAQIFAMCKGQRTPKKARNTASKEEMGTIGCVVVTKRFANSHATCVCKCRMY